MCSHRRQRYVHVIDVSSFQEDFEKVLDELVDELRKLNEVLARDLHGPPNLRGWIREVVAEAKTIITGATADGAPLEARRIKELHERTIRDAEQFLSGYPARTHASK